MRHPIASICLPAASAMHDGDCQNHNGATISPNLENMKVISALGRGGKGLVFLVQTEEGDLLALKTILSGSSIQKSRLHSDEHKRIYVEREVLSSLDHPLLPKLQGVLITDKIVGYAIDYCPGRDLNYLRRNQTEQIFSDGIIRIYVEREVLSSLDHPLLPKLQGVLITDKIVGYAIDYCPGRDLNYLRRNQTEQIFSDGIIRFYAAELVLALEYLHGLGIVYRDLKPENVMIQTSGHLMLVDFDLSTKLSIKSPQSASRSAPEIKPKKTKKFAFFSHRSDSGISPEDSAEKSNSFVGTEDYLAPEIILGHGHDFAVDWWCLGVVLYEMLYGTTPFRGSNRKSTYYRIITKEPNLAGELTPLRDLIGKLLIKDRKRRIRGHEFFKGVDWKGILEMSRPPFIPQLTDVRDINGNHEINLEKFVQEMFNTGEGKMENTEEVDNNLKL